MSDRPRPIRSTHEAHLYRLLADAVSTGQSLTRTAALASTHAHRLLEADATWVLAHDGATTTCLAADGALLHTVGAAWPRADASTRRQHLVEAGLHGVAASDSSVVFEAADRAGCISVFWRRPDMDTAEHQRVLSTVADLISVGLGQLEAYERQRRFVERAIAAQESERRRVSRELHDTTGQALTALLVGLKTLEARAASDDVSRTLLAALYSQTVELIDDVGRLARQLRPSVLDDHGLAAAVRHLARTTAESHGLEISTQVEALAPLDALGDELRTHVYRIIQEALTNVVKHAGASHASVTARPTPDGLQIAIVDDGGGFASHSGAEGARARGLGLEGIGERAALVGGAVSVSSHRGLGTAVTVELPLANK